MKTEIHVYIPNALVFINKCGGSTTLPGGTWEPGSTWKGSTAISPKGKWRRVWRLRLSQRSSQREGEKAGGGGVWEEVRERRRMGEEREGGERMDPGVKQADQRVGGRAGRRRWGPRRAGEGRVEGRGALFCGKAPWFLLKRGRQ